MFEGSFFSITATLKKNSSRKENYHVSLNELTGLARRLLSFHGRYFQYFQRHNTNLADKAFQYIKGLFQAKKKNMERMEERVPDVVYDQLQYFLSDSQWEHQPIIEQISSDADQLMGGYSDSGLYIDETGIPKKGKMSVGVARQWCGQVGKVDNCQVAVIATLGRGNFSTMIDFRLYLPEEWTKDEVRCDKAKIPTSEREFKTKHELAWDMINNARQNGVRYQWVGFDGFYGDNPEFVRKLADNNEIFMADIHSNHRIYLEDPKPYLPLRKSNQGRKPKKLKSDVKPIRVDKWVAQQPDNAWQRISLRDTTKGKLIVEILHKRIWLWDGKEKEARNWHVIVRREVNSPHKQKYSLSNASDATSVERLAYMQAQRYWVERPFQDAKQQCGMGEYQARGWHAWHHHMTLVMLAMLFMTEQRIRYVDDIPLLSCNDITEVLKFFLPRRDVTEKEVLKQIAIRHEKRQASIDAAYEKQRKNGNFKFE